MNKKSQQDILEGMAEFRKDMLEIVKKQSEEIKKVSEKVNEKREEPIAGATEKKSKDDFRCVVRAQFIRSSPLTQQELQQRVNGLSTEMEVLMRKYEVSALTASLLHQYGKKSTTQKEETTKKAEEG